MKLKVSKLKVVRSTNEEAMRLIKNDQIHPRIIISKKQTKGRGTMGKKWVSNKGNMFISIYFDLVFSKIKPNQISILNPHIIKNLLKNYVKKQIHVKWPNDLLIEDKKICGVLQEVFDFKNKKYLIIGIGLNTVHKPSNKSFKSTSIMRNSNKKISNVKILNDIKDSYEKFISDIRSNKISTLKNKYLKIKK